MENSQDTNEPVAWQSRMRTKWMRDGEWWPWRDCSKEVADDYKRAPVVNDWEYESRALYTHPQNLNCKSTQARLATLWGYEKKQPRQPLTDEELNLIASRWHLHLLEGQDKQDLFEFARAIESYSASAKLTQLTNEQISAIVANHCLNVGDWSKNGASVARAIERAHGIRGEA